MLAFFAAVLAASASSPALEASLPWWEKITVTVDGKGRQQSCFYQSSLSQTPPEACDEEVAAGVEVRGDGLSGQFSKVTIERRFSPGRQLDTGNLEPGDQLLGRQVMFLTIDAKGAIQSCRVVSRSGDAPPDYGCDAARKEQFRAQASTDGSTRQAFMTILAYGHTEEIA